MYLDLCRSACLCVIVHVHRLIDYRDIMHARGPKRDILAPYQKAKSIPVRPRPGDRMRQRPRHRRHSRHKAEAQPGTTRDTLASGACSTTHACTSAGYQAPLNIVLAATLDLLAAPSQSGLACWWIGAKLHVATVTLYAACADVETFCDHDRSSPLISQSEQRWTDLQSAQSLCLAFPEAMTRGAQQVTS